MQTCYGHCGVPGTILASSPRSSIAARWQVVNLIFASSQLEVAVDTLNAVLKSQPVSLTIFLQLYFMGQNSSEVCPCPSNYISYFS